MFYVGYDIRSEGASEVRFIEVKGKAATGAIIITSNEWKTASAQSDKYFLYIVQNIFAKPAQIKIIRNPRKMLLATERTVQYTLPRAIYMKKQVQVP